MFANVGVLIDLDSGAIANTGTTYQIERSGVADDTDKWAAFVNVSYTGGGADTVITAILETSSNKTDWFELSTTVANTTTTSKSANADQRFLPYVRVRVTVAGTAATARLVHAEMASTTGFTLVAQA